MHYQTSAVIVFGMVPQSSTDIDSNANFGFFVAFVIMASHSRFREFDDVARRFAAHDRLNMPRPCRHRCALFIGERMPLINANDTREGAAHMVQKLFDDRQINAEPGHAGRDGAPDIVQNPWRHGRP